LDQQVVFAPGGGKEYWHAANVVAVVTLGGGKGIW
jgi:hypothetical protein